MTKICFLDIDGPMIPVRAYLLANQTKLASVFDPCAVAMLNGILQSSTVQIVISSIRGQDGRAYCEQLLSSNGIDPKLMHDDWITPRNCGGRAQEIASWLTNHPDIVDYVAIDDEDLDVKIVPNAVLCDTYEGFSYKNYLECRRMLKIAGEYPERIDNLITFANRKSILNALRCGDSDKYKLEQLADELFPLR